jgi:Resolvase, N terminal domain
MTMERPALKRLLEDIKAGKVQIVVVYKVDRLTRSLADFAKIVDVLDAHNASFVSVTQQFNTTTSMERLTLNMLLSFAQFEREIAGERIRDKIAASKRKGMWSWPSDDQASPYSPSVRLTERPPFLKPKKRGPVQWAPVIVRATVVSLIYQIMIAPRGSFHARSSKSLLSLS